MCGKELYTTTRTVLHWFGKCDLCAENQRKDTSMKRYGTAFPTQHVKVKQKVKKTTQEKFGVDNISQIEGCQLLTKYTPYKLKKTSETLYCAFYNLKRWDIQVWIAFG